MLVSDTVGFVQRLPHQLVESFRSTLEEVVDADLLLHVVDAGSPDAEQQIDAVRAVLREIGADTVPELLVLNKADIATPDDVKALLGAHPHAAAVSAVTGEGRECALGHAGCPFRALAPIVEFLVPYERGDVVAALHREGEVLVEVHAEGGSRFRARLPALDPLPLRRVRRATSDPDVNDRPGWAAGPTAARCARGRDRGVRRRGQDPARQPPRARRPRRPRANRSTTTASSPTASSWSTRTASCSRPPTSRRCARCARARG